jgi:opacity protein-like surface antigen
MSLEKTAGKDLGKFMASFALEIPAEKSAEYLGACEVFEDNFRKKAHKETMSSVYKLFEQFGESETKCAKHILALSHVERDHSDHVKQASNMVFDTLGPMYKKADIGSTLVELGLPLIGGATALGGAGIGAGLWSANRASDEEDAELEAKRKKIQYYRNLVNELKAKSKLDYSL